MFAANSGGGTEISFCSCGVCAAVLRLLLGGLDLVVFSLGEEDVS